MDKVCSIKFGSVQFNTCQNAEDGRVKATRRNVLQFKPRKNGSECRFGISLWKEKNVLEIFSGIESPVVLLQRRRLCTGVFPHRLLTLGGLWATELRAVDHAQASDCWLKRDCFSICVSFVAMPSSWKDFFEEAWLDKLRSLSIMAWAVCRRKGPELFQGRAGG